MRSMIRRLWNDDAGFIVSFELMLVFVILLLGITVGLTAVRNAVVAELEETANAILALSQGYTIQGLVGCCSSIQGTEAIDVPGLVDPALCTANQIPSVIEALPCD